MKRRDASKETLGKLSVAGRFEAYDMTDTVSFSDVQLQKILTTLETMKSGGIHWDQIVPVFLSAALGMSVGVGLEYFKSYRERKKVLLERDKKELTQLNVVATAMGYNIEALLHIVMQLVLPHHKQSHAAAAALRAVENNAAQLRALGESMHSKFTAMMTRCPEPYFVELEFFKEIPFVLAKGPELLKLSGWMVSYARALKEILSERNKHIDIATSSSADEGSYLQAVEEQIRTQTHIGNIEVINSLMLLRQFLATSKRIEKITDGYKKVLGPHLKLRPPAVLDDVLRDLSRIAEAMVPEFPPPEAEI